MCNEQPSKATTNPISGKASSPIEGGLLCYILFTYSLHKVSSLKFAYLFIAHRYITSPSEKTRPESWPKTKWVRQLRSGSCHYSTAATKCNEQPSQDTAKPISGNACSPTEGGLLCYILYTYSLHKVSSMKFACLFIAHRYKCFMFLVALYQPCPRERKESGTD